MVASVKLLIGQTVFQLQGHWPPSQALEADKKGPHPPYPLINQNIAYSINEESKGHWIHIRDSYNYESTSFQLVGSIGGRGPTAC